MKLYVVTSVISGYAREDADQTTVAGVFSDPSVADYIRKAAGFNSAVHIVEVNEVKDGYSQYLTDLYHIDIKGMIKLKQAGLRPMDNFDLAHRMSADEFTIEATDGCFTSDDGVGYWATSDMVSSISCFRPLPEWATHVCWYNN